MAKERELAQQHQPQGNAQEEETETLERPRRSRWLDEDEDLPILPAADSNKRRHVPIVWQEQEQQGKSVKTSEGDHPGRSRTGIVPGMSMAERAQAELEEFRQHQSQLATVTGEDIDQAGGSEGKEERALERPSLYMKDSPEVSSPEEELHIRRERGSSYALASSGGAGRSTPSPKSPAIGVAAVVPHAQEPTELGEHPLGPQAAPYSGDDVIEAYPEVSSSSGDDEEGENERHGASDHHRDRILAEERDDGLSGGEVDGGDGHEGLIPVPVKRQVSMLNECRSVENYAKLNRISEGTYGVVYRYVEEEGRFLRISIKNKKKHLP